MDQIRNPGESETNDNVPMLTLLYVKLFKEGTFTWVDLVDSTNMCLSTIN